MKDQEKYDISITYKTNKETKDTFINILIDYMLNSNSLRKDGVNGENSNY